MYTILATSEATATDFTSMLKPIMDQITGAISPTDIVALLGIAIGFGLTFTLIWFGARKLMGMAQNAIQGRNMKA